MCSFVHPPGSTHSLQLPPLIPNLFFFPYWRFSSSSLTNVCLLAHLSSRDSSRDPQLEKAVDIFSITVLIETEIACLSDQFQRLSACFFNCTILRPYGSNTAQWGTLGDISEIALGENNSGNMYPQPQKLRADAGIHYSS